jgi:hypothetical protein
MKKIVLIIIYLTVFSSAVSAQSVGHLGKRFLINLDGTFSPSYKHPDFNGYFGYFKFNYRITPSLEFVLGKKISVGVLFSYAPTMFSPTIEPFNHSVLNMPLNINGYGAFFKKYFSFTEDNHAPYGSYFMVSASRLNYQYQGILGEGAGNNYAFQIEIGYNYLLFNRLRLTWGASIGGTTSGFYFGFDEDFFPIKKKLQTLNDFAENRIFGTYMFGTKIGIGFLAF